MRRWLAVVGVLVLLGCGGGGSDAGDVVRSALVDVSDGKFRAAWDDMHPAQQELIGYDEWSRCMRDAGVNLTAVKVVDVEEVGEQQIPGTEETAETAEVTVRLEVGSASDTDTFLAARDGGEWRWVARRPNEEC